MADRIEIIVNLTGDKEAASSLENLKRTAERLQSQKIQAKIDTSDVDRGINRLRKGLDTLLHQKATLKFSGGSIDNINEKIRNTRERIKELQRQKADINIDAKVNNTALEQTVSLIHEAEAGAIGLRDVLSTLGGAFSTVGGAFSTIGGGLQSLGRTFGGGALNTITRTLTAYGTVMATQGLGKAASRFDTFRTFPKLMEASGYSSEQAAAAVEKLNQSVLGLPTPLDEIVDSAKQYVMLLGDMDKGTDLAIAANNAFLANASDAQQVYYGMRQIRDLIAKGELRTQEWDSLFGSLGISLQYVAEEFGFTTEEIGTFRSALKDGSIDGESFVNALIKAGTGTGKLVEMAEVQKDTISAVATNIKTAFANLGATMLQSFDELFMERTGKGLPDNLKLISDGIKNEIIPALKDWTNVNADKIMGFFDALRNYDWMGLFSKIGGNIENLFNIIGKVIGAVPEGMMQDFVAFAMVYATPLGKAFSLAGGLFKTMGGFLKTLSGIPLPSLGNIGRLAGGLGGVAKVMPSLKDMGKSFLGFTITAVEIAAIGAVIWEYAKIAQTIADIDLGDNSTSNAKAVAGLFAAGGALTAIITGITTFASSTGVGAGALAIGELLGAGFILELGMLADTVGKFADVANVIGGINVNWEMVRRNTTNLGQLMSELAGIGAWNMFTGFAGMIGAGELKVITDTIPALLDAVSLIGKAEFPTVAQLGKAKAAFSQLASMFDTGILDGIATFFGNLFGVYEAQKGKIDTAGGLFKSLIGTFDDINAIADTNIKLTGAKANIESVMMGISDSMNSIQQTFGVDVEGVTAKAGTDSRLIANMKSLFGNLASLMTEVDSLNATFKTKEGKKNIAQKFGDIKTDLEEMLRGSKELVDLLTGSDWASGRGVEKKADVAGSIVSNITTIFDSVGSLITSMNSIAGSFELNAVDVDGRYVDKTAMVIGQVRHVLSQVAELVREDVFASLPNLGTRGKEGQFMGGGIGDRLQGLATGMAAVKEVMATMQDIGTVAGADVDFGTIGDQISTTFTKLMSAFALIPEDSGETLLPKAQALQNAVGQLKATFDSLQAIQGIMSGGEGGEGLSTEGISGIIQSITQAFNAEAIDTSGLETLRTAVENVKTQVTELGQVDISPLTDKVSALSGALDTAKTSSDNARSAVQALGDASLTASGKLSALASAIGRVTGSAYSAAGAVRGLINTIAALQSKDVYVRVHYQQIGSIGSVPGASTGGLIGRNGSVTQYRASGGSIFRPRGTDTVPAMLTPGEYVMRAKAVKTFGVEFMKNINRLNISGALRSLVSRSHIHHASPVAGNNSRHYDNHATVNQTIYTNNQNFTFRRANRYVEALR